MVGQTQHNSLYPLFAVLVNIMWVVTGFIIVSSVYVYPYIIAMMLLACCFGYGKTLLRLQIGIIPVCLFVAVSAQVFASPYTASMQALRMYIIAVAAVLTLSINPAALISICTSKGLPTSLSIGIMITLRFFVVFREEIRRIRLAVRLRGISILREPSIVMRAFVIPIIVRVFTISDIMSMSLEIRHFDSTAKRSLYNVPVPHMQDVLFLVVATAISTGGLVLFYVAS